MGLREMTMTAFDTRREGGFTASPGWSALFAASDAIVNGHEARAGHPVVVSVKSKGCIDYGRDCCDDLFESLLLIERASAITCQACGAPGEPSGYLVECAAHRGQWPYGEAD
jgi:hypothetical protein